MIIKDNFNSISEKWITSNFFISEKFIQCFVSNNKSLRHLFIKQNNNLIYSQFFNINLEKNVILSSWIAAISPVWHYVGVNVIGLGISKNLKHVKKITKFLK